MHRVIIESPYRGLVAANLAYARLCMLESFSRGEAPIAFHLLYTQPGILDDNDPMQREWGIGVSHLWIERADAMAVYTDLGISEGMQWGIDVAEAAKIPVFYRKLRDAPHWRGREGPSLEKTLKIWPPAA